MRGEIIILEFPYGDAGGFKIRPALVIQDDSILSVNVVVALITSQMQRVGPSRLLIDPSTPAGQGSGRRVPSVVLCENLYSPHRDRVLRSIGHLPVATMSQNDACLKAALGLS